MSSYPHVIVDFKHRSLEVILNDGSVDGTLEFDDAHLMDVDADGRPVALEILALGDLKVEEMAQSFGFAEDAPAIRAAIQRAFSRTGTAVSYGRPKVIPGKVIIHASPESESEAAPNTPAEW